MSSEGRLTVLLGDGRCNVLVQVFEVGRKLPLLDTNLICGEMENPNAGSSSAPQTNCKM